ncbi:uncharacterized protein DS421_8g237690 [Arachis hypogaea]|nr:uncharacterized protein DS421_8g237690 [Arachis hypogaea]
MEECLLPPLVRDSSDDEGHGQNPNQQCHLLLSHATATIGAPVTRAPVGGSSGGRTPRCFSLSPTRRQRRWLNGTDAVWGRWRGVGCDGASSGRARWLLSFLASSLARSTLSSLLSVYMSVYALVYLFCVWCVFCL